MTYKNKLIIILSLMLILIPNSLAWVNVYFDTPNQNNEYLTDYPQIIRAYIQSNESITNCIHDIDGMTYTTYQINVANVDLIKTFKLGEGTYNITINCTNGNENGVDSRLFKVSETMLFRESQERNFQTRLFLIIFVALLILYFITYENYVGILSSGFMIVMGIWLTNIIKYNIVTWFPILIGIILFLNTIVQLYRRKK